MKLLPYLKLIRIPNLPTVFVDVCAGYFVASRSGLAGLSEPIGRSDITPMQPLIILIISAMLLYAGGMANNDLQHEEKDWVLKKPRPIVQGLISSRSAFIVSIVGIFGGALLANFALGGMAWIAYAIAICIYAYNSLSKGRRVDTSYIPPKRWQNVLGSVLMSLCRVGSVGMGVALGALVRADGKQGDIDLSDPVIWIFLGTTLFYFLCVMSASLLEDFGGGKRALRALAAAVLVPIWTGPILLAWLVYSDSYNEAAAWSYQSLTVWLTGSMNTDEIALARATWGTLARTVVPAGALLVALTLLVQSRIWRAVKDPKPRNVGMIVKWSILGHVLLESAFVLQTHREFLPIGIALASVFVLCTFLGRFTYST